PPAVRLPFDRRAVVKQNVHQAPVVDERQAVGDILIPVTFQRDCNAGDVPIRTLFAELAEIAPGAALEIAPRGGREEPASFQRLAIPVGDRVGSARRAFAIAPQFHYVLELDGPARA